MSQLNKKNKKWFKEEDLVPKGNTIQRKPRDNNQYEAKKEAVKTLAEYFLLDKTNLESDITTAQFEIGRDNKPRPGAYVQPYRLGESGTTITVEKNGTKYEFPVLDVWENDQIVKRGLFGSRDFWTIINSWYKPKFHAKLRVTPVPYRFRCEEDPDNKFNSLNLQISGFITFNDVTEPSSN